MRTVRSKIDGIASIKVTQYASPILATQKISQLRKPLYSMQVSLTSVVWRKMKVTKILLFAGFHRKQENHLKSMRCEWLGRLDSNQRMAVPKTAALPLGDAPILKGKWWFHRGEPGAKLSKKAGEIKEKTRTCPNRMKTPITSGNDNNIAKSADLRSGLAFSYSCA